MRRGLVMGNNGAEVDRLGIATDSGLVMCVFGLQRVSGLSSDWSASGSEVIANFLRIVCFSLCCSLADFD